MTRTLAMLFCSLLGIFLSSDNTSRTVETDKLPAAELVNEVRFLNSAEFSYQDGNGRYVNGAELLAFLRTSGALGKSPIDLENLKTYQLAVIASQDGKHYQITLKPMADAHDENAACRAGAFSDDAGVIFVGTAHDCKTSESPE